MVIVRIVEVIAVPVYIGIVVITKKSITCSKT